MPAPSGQTVQAGEAAEKKPSLVNEPSMEDILASIRRIIAADQTGLPLRTGFTAPAVSASGEEPAFATPHPDDFRSDPEPAVEPATVEAEDVWQPSSASVDVLASMEPPAAAAGPTDAVFASSDAKPTFRSLIEPDADETPTASFTSGASPDVYDLHESERVDASPYAEPLISSAAGASISSSFQALAQSVLVNDPEMIDRLAREALRPMLKAWLDENLPGMVERLVRTEIERVARGGRHRD